MVRQSYRHQKINLYSSTGKNCKTFRGDYPVLKPGVFDPKTIIKGSRTTFFYALGDRPISSTFYQKQYHFIEKKISWLEQKLVSKNVTEELKFWRSNINIYNRNKFKPRPLTSSLLFTDASDIRLPECLAKFDRYEKGTS